MKRVALAIAALGASCAAPVMEARGEAPRAPAPARSAAPAPSTAPSGRAAATPSAPPPGSAPAALEPRGTRTLAVPGFQDATVSFPRTATLPAPVLIVAHGAGNTPGGMCETFRAVVGDRAVLLCPAGPRVAAREEGRYYPDHFALEKIVFASLAALRATFPHAVDVERAVYGGYSQGATMGALVLPAHGRECPLAALVEGGVEGWTLARAKRYRDDGGRRLLFACGTSHCRQRAARAAEVLRRAGLDARVVSEVTAGHTYGGAVADAIAASFDWLVQDDPRFAPGPKGPPRDD